MKVAPDCSGGPNIESEERGMITSCIRITTTATTRTFQKQIDGFARARELAAANVIFAMELVDIEGESDEERRHRETIEWYKNQLKERTEKLNACELKLAAKPKPKKKAK